MKYIIRFSTLFIFWSKWIKMDQTWSNSISDEIIIEIYHQIFNSIYLWSDWIRSVQNCQYNQICSFYQFHLFQFSKSSIILITFDKFCHFYIFNYHVLLFYIVHDLFNLFNQFYILVFKIIFNLPILIFNNQATRAQD